MQDVTFNTRAKDIAFSKVKTPEAIRQVIWGKLFDSDYETYAYMNVIIPSDEIKEVLNNKVRQDIYIHASYNPSLMPVLVRFCVVNKKGEYEDKGAYLAQCSIDNCLEKTRILASQLPAVDLNGDFAIHVVENIAYLYSTSVADVAIGDDEGQSAELLCLCQPGNLYRYPTVGVDGFSYINSILPHTELASVLTSQFSTDGKTIETAELNNATGEITTQYNDNEVELRDNNLTDVSALNTEVIGIGEKEMASIVLSGNSYSLMWLSGSIVNVTYSPLSSLEVPCEAIVDSSIPGKITYKIKRGDEFANLDESTGLVTLSNVKAGGIIIISATFTPQDMSHNTSISIEKTIVYHKASSTIEWIHTISPIVSKGDNLNFQAWTNGDGGLSYTKNDIPFDGIIRNIPIGEYKITASVSETKLYKAASKTIYIQAVRADLSDDYIYIGVSPQYDSTPNTKQEVKQGMVISDVNELVLDCSGSDWKTIWIAVPESINSFNGILYDYANDETQMFVKVTDGYKIWYWTQLMSITQIYSTTKKTKRCS